MFRNSQNLFQKINNANGDFKQWFKAVCETKDDRFIIQNVECQIAKKPFSKDLWKLYIQFLLNKNGKVRCKTRWGIAFINQIHTDSFNDI